MSIFYYHFLYCTRKHFSPEYRKSRYVTHMPAFFRFEEVPSVRIHQIGYRCGIANQRNNCHSTSVSRRLP